MADPVASVDKIVKLGLVIKNAVDTARHNEEECCEIKKRVLRFSAILSQLQQGGLMDNNPAISGALEDLEETLERALELVMECQDRHMVTRFLGAGSLARQLRRVKDDILNKVMLASFAINTHTTIVLLTIHQAGGHPPSSWLQLVTEAVDISHNSRSTKDVVSPSADLRIFTLSELEAAITNRTIGIGCSYSVFKGVLNDGNVVAIKIFNQPQQAHTHDQLILVSKLQHKNIVKLVVYFHEVGYFGPVRSLFMRLFKGKNVQVEERNYNPRKKENMDYIWVEEYIPNGNLDEIIKESRLDWSCIFRIIEGLAQGLHYLHEQRIVHRDVKPANILLDSDMNPKITDFEISLVLDDDETIVDSIAGTLGYIGPETHAYLIVSAKTDVYSFGITLLETVASIRRSKEPKDYHFLRWAWEAWEDGRIVEEFDPSVFDESQLTEIERCVEVGLLCSQWDRADRPTMADVCQMLNGKKDLPTRKKPSYIKRDEESWIPTPKKPSYIKRDEESWIMPGSPSAWSDGSISPR